MILFSGVFYNLDAFSVSPPFRGVSLGLGCILGATVETGVSFLGVPSGEQDAALVHPGDASQAFPVSKLLFPLSLEHFPGSPASS